MIELVEQEDTPEGTLKSMLDRAEHFDGVIVIATSSDGTQFLRCSRMGIAEKSYLMAFAQSWLTGLFIMENDR